MKLSGNFPNFTKNSESLIKAILDLGTNTFNLLIAEIKGNQLEQIFKTQEAVKLGEGGINQGKIMPAPFERGVNAVKKLKERAGEFKAEEIIAIATSAIRSASNGDDFIQRVKEQTGVTIQKIDGNAEAAYIFEGVKNSVPMDNQNILVMDIGGGSVEFIIGNQNGIRWKQSFNIGAARLIDKFHRKDPIGKDEISDLKNHLLNTLGPLLEAVEKYPVNKMVGSAGSFESIIDLILELLHKKLMDESQSYCRIPLEYFHQIYQIIIASTEQERKNMKSIPGFRVEMMVVSAILMDFVLENLKIKELFCTTYALREGILFSKLKMD